MVFLVQFSIVKSQQANLISLVTIIQEYSFTSSSHTNFVESDEINLIRNFTDIVETITALFIPFNKEVMHILLDQVEVATIVIAIVKASKSVQLMVLFIE